MFSVGRYDPNQVGDTTVVVDGGGVEEKEKIKESETKKRKINNNDNDDNNVIDNNHDDDSVDSSSSCPSSSDDDSSSSVPSSSSSDDDSDDSDDGNTPAFKVIAPEQKIKSIDITRKKLDTTNEGIDDFDHDDNNSKQQSTNQSNEIQKALRMSQLGIEEAAKIWNLAPFLVDNLVKDDYKSFFPIQALVIPDVIASERHAHIRNRDICVSSPTGSGKTLAFVLPVLNSLSRRKICRLRALVVLPSRDLATQVYQVFERYSNGSDLKIGLAIGQNDFQAEQKNITIGSSYHPLSKNYQMMQYANDPFSFSNAMDAFGDFDKVDLNYNACAWAEPNLKRLPGFTIPNGGCSAIDVLVCTPGRLMDHLDKTPGFTLQHLQFLVIDEADRLVNQSYQNWIQRVVTAASSGPDSIRKSLPKLANNHNNIPPWSIVDPVTWRREEGRLNNQSSDMLDLQNYIDVSVCRRVQLRKFLFSATLTKDPKKLMSLGLVNPKQFDAHQFNRKDVDSNKSSSVDVLGYTLPTSLSEYMVECTAEQKPLVLLAVLLEQGLLDRQKSKLDGITVVFTSSKDSTHRLTRLLQLLWVAGGYGSSTSIGEFSSAMNQKQRANLMKRCNNANNADEEDDNNSRIQVIVCSDGMSRGMDIESVSAVVNYDVPSFAKTYVHRCGRTARAGRKGRAISIMKGGQVTKFLKMRKLIENSEKVTTIGIKKDLVKSAIPVYKKCVKILQKVMSAEENDELAIDETLGAEWFVD